MLLEELLQEEHEEGLRQGRIAERTENIQRLTDLLFLKKFDKLPDSLFEKIEAGKDPDRFMQWIQFAAESASLPDFLSKIE